MAIVAKRDSSWYDDKTQTYIRNAAHAKFKAEAAKRGLTILDFFDELARGIK